MIEHRDSSRRMTSGDVTRDRLSLRAARPHCRGSELFAHAGTELVDEAEYLRVDDRQVAENFEAEVDHTLGAAGTHCYHGRGGL